MTFFLQYQKESSDSTQLIQVDSNDGSSTPLADPLSPVEPINQNDQGAACRNVSRIFLVLQMCLKLFQMIYSFQERKRGSNNSDQIYSRERTTFVGTPNVTEIIILQQISRLKRLQIAGNLVIIFSISKSRFQCHPVAAVAINDYFQ